MHGASCGFPSGIRSTALLCLFLVPNPGIVISCGKRRHAHIEVSKNDPETSDRADPLNRIVQHVLFERPSLVLVKCSELELSLTQVGFSFSRVPVSGKLGNGWEQRPRSVGQAWPDGPIPPIDAATTSYSQGLEPEARNCGRRLLACSAVRTLGFWIHPHTPGGTAKRASLESCMRVQAQ